METKEILDHLNWLVDYVVTKLRLVEKETGEKYEYYSALISKLRRVMKNLDDSENLVNDTTMNRIWGELETINDDLSDIVRKHNKTSSLIQE